MGELRLPHGSLASKTFAGSMLPLLLMVTFGYGFCPVSDHDRPGRHAAEQRRIREALGAAGVLVLPNAADFGVCVRLPGTSTGEPATSDLASQGLGTSREPGPGA